MSGSATQAFASVTLSPVMASDLEQFGSAQEMAKSQLAKVIASLSNIAVFGVKESARVAAAKVLCEVAAGKYEVHKEDAKKIAGQKIPADWATTLMPPPNAMRANGQPYQASA